MYERAGMALSTTRRWRCDGRCAAVAFAAWGWVMVAAAGAATAQDLSTRTTLSGNWGGQRQSLIQHGVDLEAVWIGDVFADVDGGVRRRADYLGNFDLTLNVNLDALTGYPAGTIFIYGLGIVGDDPSRDVGDAQGVDGIAAPGAARLYEAWWQRSFLDDRLSLLAGLYDVSSEFDVIDSAAVFINSSFGMGADFGMSGVNGPSAFPPTTSLGLRARAALVGPLVVQAAVLDGIPGDPDGPHGTHVILRDGDGLLVVTEAAVVWKESVTAAAAGPSSVERQRRRRVGRGRRVEPRALKLAFGAWFYTTQLHDLVKVDAQGRPLTQRGDPGYYVLADVDLYREGNSATQGISLFMRAGIADGDVQQFAGFAGGGLVYTGLIRERDDDQTGVGVVAAINGGGFKRAGAAAGTPASEAEVALELTYRVVLTPWFSLQPDVQYVIDPGGTTRNGNALVLGLRSEITF